MAGTKAGGEAAAKSNKERYGESFYARIALKAQESWRKNGRKPRGFAVDRVLAANSGAVGGALSRRKPNDSPVRQPSVKVQQAKRVKPCTYCDRPGHTSYSCEMRLQTIARNKVRAESDQDDYDKLSRIAARFAK